jgi:ubiquinone/menaquinone biosynthesis C-methylase UbiE
MRRIEGNQMKRACPDEKHYRLHDFDQRYPFLHTIAKTLVEKFAPESVLDVGCAEGYLVYAFKELGVQAYGVDISDYAISHSPEQVREFLFKVDTNCEDLPFEDKSFDMATAMDIVEHLQNYDKLICEMGRILKPEGIVCVTTPANRYVDTFLALALGHLPTTHKNIHINVHKKAFWIDAFESHGFDYLEDFPKDILKRATITQTPVTKVGHLLVRFGKPGSWLRDKLAFRFRSEALLFKHMENK